MPPFIFYLQQRIKHVLVRNAATDQFPLHFDKEASRNDIENRDEDRVDRPDFSANTIGEGVDQPRPGEEYTIYNTQDILGSLPTDLELVISRAARWAGVEDNYVCSAVERFERRVLRWWDRQQRKERAERFMASASE